MKAILFTCLFGTCLACCGESSDPCRDVDCSGHGRCAVQGGDAVCLCHPGYVADGTSCVEDPCAGACVHGTCEPDGSCTCQPGYTGTRCDQCDDGYHPEGLACVVDTPCDAFACLHGSCVLEEDVPTCVCDPGWAGEHCDACADGYHPSGERCVRDSACDPDPCVFGVCSDVDGQALCACDEGTTGARCDQCADGWVPQDLVCVPAGGTPCDPNPCNEEHRTVCEVTGDTYACRCDPGYHDDGSGACVEDQVDPCDPNPCHDAHRTVCIPQSADYVCACDPGYQDEDGDGTCLADCDTAGLSCPEHAHCEIAGGEAACRCDPGYQDNDDDGSCRPTCSTAGLDCPEGEMCDDRSGEAQCVPATKPPIYISFLWHMHQPIYWPYESIVATETSGAMGYSLYSIHLDRSGPYTAWPRDAIDAGRDLPHLGAQVSFSGSLMENLDDLEAAGAGFIGWTDPWTQAAGWLTQEGNPRLDLVNFGYHHPLMGLIDPLDIRLQIETHRVARANHFGGTQSKGIFPPECAFSERMIPALEDAGVEWVLVDNIHFDRAHADYPYRPESNLPPPNPADQRNQDPTGWVQLDGLWAPSPVSVPWGYQPHWVEATDPATGQTSRIIAVPAARYEGNEDARGGFGALQYEAVMSQYEEHNTDPLHPMLVVLHHDGDNYGGGTESYYHGNFQSFVQWLRDHPDRFAATTIQDYLDRFPPDPDDVIYVEDGSWSGADNGDPEFHKWNGDPDADGYAPDRNSWAVITAAKNRVLTAESIQPHTTADAIVAGGGNATDRAWHYLLNAETSCYWYWDNSMGGIWDSHPTRAANMAVVHADEVLAGGTDGVGPTIYLPQREPYNPGRDDQPADFEVWTFVYDVSGLDGVTLYVRVDPDGTVDSDNHLYAGDWIDIPMSGQSIASQTDPLPDYKADRYGAIVSGYQDVLVDYYVAAEDSGGNTASSPILHVWVGSGGSGPGSLWSPAEPTADDVITITWSQPAKLHWGVDASLHGGAWSPPPAEYWPAGSVDWGDGHAIESPLGGPDGDGNYTVQIGPFNQTPVAEVNFVFHNDNDTWSSPDQVIPIGR